HVLHESYRGINRHVASERGKLIPGVLKTCRTLRERDIAIGTTTGYSRDIMEHVIAVARAQGFEADVVVCADDVPVSRPSPLAVYDAMVSLGVYPASAMIKVDDTVPGLMEGKAAGTWTVGVSETGNEIGLSEEALAALPARERIDLANVAAKRLTDAGADYVVGSIAEIPSIVDDINERLADGERPELFEYEPEAA
ncbi:MAG: HAD hydrolase-like protein, partial [Oricola sp.]